MRRNRTGRARRALAAVLAAGCASQVLGQATITWNNAAGGTFSTAGNWNPSTVPGALDTAVFPVFGVSYTLHFTNSPTISNYNFTGGTCSVNSVGAIRTLSIANDFSVTGGSSGWGFGTLAMAVNIADDMFINGGRLFVDEGYDFTCDQLNLATLIGASTMTFQGAGTTFTANSAGNFIGQNGGSGTMEFELGAAGIFSGNLGLAVSGVANSKAFVTVSGGSDLVVGGNLNAGTGVVSGQTTTINLLDAGSTLVMNGAGSFNLGAANTSAATLSIGAGATFSTGTGATLVNATGRIVNSGNFIMNGSGTFTGQGAIGVAGRYDGGSGNYIQAANTSVVFQTDAAGTFSTLTLNNPGSQMAFNGVATTLAVFGTTNLGAVGGVSSLSFNGSQATLGGDLNIADTAGEQGVVTVTGGANVTLADDLDIGISTGANTQGTLNITGIGATSVFQNANNTIAVGATSGGQGTINLTGGRLTTATGGTVTVNSTGQFIVNGGTLNLNGRLDVNGGVFQKTTASVLNTVASGAITASNGASVTIDGGLDTPASFLLTATGSSTLDFGTGSLQVHTGSSLSVDGGSDVIATALRVGTTGGPGVATFSGSGTTIRTTSGGNFLQIGQSGNQGTVTLSSFAVGTFTAGIGLADSGSTSSAGTLSILSGADVVTNGDIRIGAGGAVGQSGRVSINGSSSTLTQTGAGGVTVGAASNSTGHLVITSGTMTTGTGAFVVNNFGLVEVYGTLNTGGDMIINSPSSTSLFVSDFGGTVGRLTVAGTLNAANTSTISLNRGTITANTFINPRAIRFTMGTSDQATIVVNGGNFNLGVGSYILDGTSELDNATSRLQLTNGASLTVSGTDTFFVGGTNTNADLRIESGSILAAASLVGIFVEGGFDPDKTANTVVDGVGSRLSLFNLGINDVFDFGLGTVSVQNGGSISVGSQLVMADVSDVINIKVGGTFFLAGAATVIAFDQATMNLTGGTLSLGSVAQLNDFFFFGDANFNFNSGTLRFRGSTDITPDLIDRLLINRTISFGQAIQVDGTGTFTGAMVLDGGTLTVQSLQNASQVQLRTGQLNITTGALSIGPTGQLGANLTLGEGMTVNTVGGTNVQAGGLLRLNGGKIDSAGNLTVSAGGEVELLGSTSEVVSPTFTNFGLTSGSGRVNARLSNASGGIVRASTGQFLRFTTPAVNNTNSGTIQMLGGNIEFVGTFTNNSSGNVTGEGNLIVNSGITNIGTMTFSGGPTSVLATLVNNSGSDVVVTGGAHATFFNPVTNNAGSNFKVAEASIAAFLAPVTGLAAFTGPGTKIFESTATGGELRSFSGRTRVESDGDLSATSIRDATLEVVGEASILFNAMPSVSRLNTLTIEGATDAWTGRLDLANNALVIDYSGATPRATVLNQIKSGFARGAWNGAGIRSSSAAVTPNRAIGIAEASEIGSPATFLGEPIDSTSLLMRFTLPGDANLDATVNIGDFALLAANFNTPSYWRRGDFNFDQITDIGDFALLAANFNQVLPADLPALGGAEVRRPTAVPEPALAMAYTLLAASARRQRRSLPAHDGRHLSPRPPAPRGDGED